MYFGKYTVQPMSVMRQKIAEHMVASKRVSPHVYSVDEADMTQRCGGGALKSKNECSGDALRNKTYLHAVLSPCAHRVEALRAHFQH